MKIEIAFSVVAALAAFVSSATVCDAQKIAADGHRSGAFGHVRRAAVLPIVFIRNGKSTDNAEATEAFRKEFGVVMNRFAIDQVDAPHVSAAWQQATGQYYDGAAAKSPAPKDLVRLGRVLGVDQVIFCKCAWDVHTVWGALGPKTHADATVDLWIANVHQSKFELKADRVNALDTEKEVAWRAAVDVLWGPIDWVSAGPETPHMKRSGVLALDKALEPWVALQDRRSLSIRAR